MIGKKRLLIFAGVFLFVGLASYARAQERARAEIKNAEGKSVGTAGLRQTKGGVVIALRLTALPPGLHAVHIHPAGKCEAPGFTSAGGHFNPLNMKHGLRNTDGPHAGDLPDLYVNTRWRRALQSAGTEYFARRGKAHTDGKAIVVHAASDDNITDP